MKIKVLSSCAGIDFCFQPGQIVDAKTELATDLIGGGLAEEIKLPSSAKPKDATKAQTAAKQKAGADKDAET